RVLSTQGEERDLPPDKVATALNVPGDLLADEVGFIKEKGTAADEKIASQKSVAPVKSPDRRTTAGAKPSPSTTGGAMIDRAMNGQANRQDNSAANAKQENKTSPTTTPYNQVPSKINNQPRSQTPVKN